MSQSETTQFRKTNTYYNLEPFTVDVEIRSHRTDSSAPNKFVLSFRGSVRTVLEAPLVAYGDWDRSGAVWTNNIELGAGSYQLCGAEEIVGEYRGLGLEHPRTLSLTVGGVCKHIANGNPLVKLDFDYIIESEVLLLDLSGLTPESDILTLNSERTLGSDLLLNVLISNDPKCLTFPDPNDNDFRGSDINHNSLGVPHGNPYPYPTYSCSKFNPDAPVFALLPDGGYAIHDLRVRLRANTIDDPLMDGGGAAVLKAAQGGEKQVVYCANAAMNPFNEHGCKLSYDPNACRSFHQSLTHGLALDEINLKRLDDVVGRSFYAVSGLHFDASITIDAKRVDLPCDFNKISRWVPVDAAVCAGEKSVACVTSEDCIPSIDSTTEDEFSKWINFSNHDNDILRDVHFRGTCHHDDVAKFGMAVQVEAEDQCYLNVHPDHM